MKGLKTNLLLLLVLAGLSGFMYWYVYKKKPETELAELASKKIYALSETSSATRLSIRYKDPKIDLDLEVKCLENCGLSNPNANWQMEKPIAFKADAANISSFINSISITTLNETLALGDDPEKTLENFGLTKDKRESKKIEITVDGKTLRLYIGDDAPIDENLYAYLEVDGQKPKLVLVSIGVRNLASRKLGYWRSKKIFEFAQSQVEGFRIENANGVIELEKVEFENKDTEWLVKNAPKEREHADQPTVDTFITGLVFMNATDYLSDDKSSDMKKNRFPQKPRVKLSIQVAASKADPKQGEKRLSFDIYDVQVQKNLTKTFATFSDKNFIVELDRVATDKFNKKPQDFWHKTPVPAALREKIKTVRASLFGKDEHERVNAEFTQNASKEWVMAKKSPYVDTFDSKRVEETLDRIVQLKVVEYYPDRKYPKSNTIELSKWDLVGENNQILRSFQLLGDPTRRGDFFIKILSSPYKGEIGKLEKAAALSMPINMKGFQKLATEPQKHLPAGDTEEADEHDHHHH